MAEIDQIVNVTITRQTSSPSIASFDGILIANEFLISDITPAFTERVREYESLSQLSSEGFAVDSVTYLAAQAIFAQNPSVNSVYVGRKLTGADGTETWTEALTAMNDEKGESFYAVTAGTHTLADQQEISDWTESNKKLYGASSNDSNIPDGSGDIAEYAESNSYDRTFVLYHPDADLSTSDPFPAEAWIGKQFPKDPGSSNWAYKTLAGVSAYGLLSGQRSTIEGKNGNWYTEVQQISSTKYGTVGSAEYIDIIRGTDWLEARIQQTVYTLLLQSEKVPYTDNGIQAVVGQVREALNEAVDVGLITDDYIVTAPLASEVSTADKANRELNDVEFTATYQGAINKVTIQGTISL